MKAAVLHKARDPLVVTNVDLDKPKREEVLVRIAASGICASDLHVIDGHSTPPMPLVLGHEGAGVVEAVGEGVTTLQKGDHVVICLTPSCGRCFFCAKGRPNLCERMPNKPKGLLMDGTSRLHLPGAPRKDLYHYNFSSSFAEYAVSPEHACMKISKEAPFEWACLVGCGVLTGIGAVLNTAKVEPGSSVAVFGCGGVGLSAVQGAVLSGANPVIAVDIVPSKLGYAKKMGATHVVNSATEDPVAAIHKITGRGADYAFEVIGVPKVIQQMFASTRQGGTGVIVGSPPADSSIPLDLRFIMAGERRLLGCNYGTAKPWTDIPMIVDLAVAGKLKLNELVTHTAPLDAINDSIALVKAGKVARSVIVNR